MREEPLFLVSVQSKLAYQINENFYHGMHFVWCSPGFDCPGNPDKSNPRAIFTAWREDILNKNLKSSFIDRNKQGILRGIKHHLSQGWIDDRTANFLEELTDKAEFDYFCPILYVIPYQLVKHLVEGVELEKRAGAFSTEFKIPDLPPTFFNVFEI